MNCKYKSEYKFVVVVLMVAILVCMKCYYLGTIAEVE